MLYFQKMADSNSLPLLSKNRKGYQPFCFPEDNVVSSYFYFTAIRPGMIAYTQISDSTNFMNNWTAASIFGEQINAGPNGDMPGDVYRFYGGTVYRNVEKNFFNYAAYASMAAVELILTSEEGDDVHEGLSSLAVLFHDAPSTPFGDLDDIERYGWEIDGDDAYPVVVRHTGEDEWVRPSASDFCWLVALLRALPDFVEQHMGADDAGYYCPAQATVALPPVHGGKRIALSCAAGEHPHMYLLDEDVEPVPEAWLETFTSGWYWDDASRAYARDMATFIFGFLSEQFALGLSDATLRKHQRNCWYIGLRQCDYAEGDTFSPLVFLNGPRFTGSFQREVNASASALASYKATWNKLERYVRDQGDDEEW